MDEITISLADLSESRQAEAVVCLMTEYAAEMGDPLTETTQKGLCPALRERAGCVVILAWDQERPVGLVIAFEGFSTFLCQPLLNIHDVMVTASHRGRGLSKQLMQEIERVAWQRGCCKLTLEVLSNNRPALASYRSLGYGPYELDPALGQAVFWQKKLVAPAE